MQFEASRLEGLEHRTDAQSAPEVFFTPIITPESLVAAYHALGRKPEGKTAIKVHSGESEKSNNLNPSLVKDLVQRSAARSWNALPHTTAIVKPPKKAFATFKKHGYADLAPIQIMDMSGEIEIPVARSTATSPTTSSASISTTTIPFSCCHISKAIRWEASAARFKNVSIGIASSNGKRWIHSAGVTKDKWVETPQDAFLESMAEADEAVISHMHGKMMYLNVMNRLSVDCDCLASPTEPDMHDIGVLSSLDPVALDQACVDLIHTAPDGASVTERIASLHGEHILEYAEELGIGSRAYRLTVLD